MQPLPFLFLDDIADIIDTAKNLAANANDTAEDAMNRLDSIKDELKKINTLPPDSNLNNVLNDVDKSGNNPDWEIQQ